MTNTSGTENRTPRRSALDVLGGEWYGAFMSSNNITVMGISLNVNPQPPRAVEMRQPAAIMVLAFWVALITGMAFEWVLR